MKDSGRPAPNRLVSSSDSGDMAGVMMVPFPSLTKRGSSDSAICSLESCSSPDLRASGREARQQKQKGRAEEVARRTSNCVRGRSAARITLERAKASRAPPRTRAQAHGHTGTAEIHISCAIVHSSPFCPQVPQEKAIASPFSPQIHNKKGDRVVLRHDCAKFHKGIELFSIQVSFVAVHPIFPHFDNPQSPRAADGL